MSVMPGLSGRLSVGMVIMLLCAWQGVPARGEEPRLLDPAESQVRLEREGLKVVWSQDLSQAVPDRTLRAVYATGGLVILETTDANLIHIDAQKGTWRGATSLKGPLSQPPVSAKDGLYALRGGTVLSLDPRTGHVVKTLPLRLAESAPAALYERSLVVGTEDGKIARFDLKDGLVIWRKSVQGVVKDQPIVQSGVVYAAGYRGSVVAVYAENGALLWSWTPNEPAQITSGLLLDGMKLYVGDNQGFIYCLDAETGMPHWKYPLGRPVSSCTALKDAKVLACTYPGTIRCLRRRNESHYGRQARRLCAEPRRFPVPDFRRERKGVVAQEFALRLPGCQRRKGRQLLCIQPCGRYPRPRRTGLKERKRTPLPRCSFAVRRTDCEAFSCVGAATSNSTATLLSA